MKDPIKEGYIRVSSISSAYAGYGKVPQHILDRAAARGECVHKLIFDYTNDIVIPNDRYEFMGDKLDGYFESFLKYWEPLKDVTIRLQEQRLYEEDFGTTGEPDLLAVIEGKNTLLDWKCTASVGKHWIIQGGGYLNLIHEQKLFQDIERILFVKLDKNGNYPDITAYGLSEASYCFVQAIELYKMFFKDQKCNLEMD